MLLGKRLKLTRPTTGMHLFNGTATLVTIPPNGVIRVLSGPNSNGKLGDKGIVYVLWEERTVALFAVDVEDRAVEVKGPDDGLQDHKSAVG